MVEALPGPARRLYEELAEDRIVLDPDASLAQLLVTELDYARRIPAFEGRRPMYGSFSLPDGCQLADHDGLIDLVPLAGMSEQLARTFADGRSAFVVHRLGEPSALACFDRPVQYESELVALQQSTGARIVQRTAVLGQVRLFTDRRVVSWNGQSWSQRPTAEALAAQLLVRAPQLEPEVARGVLELAVHWLSPSRVGATIVVHEQHFDWASLDVATKSKAPQLSLRNRRHFPALYAALAQHDLATLATADGAVMYLSVGLRSSTEAERTLNDDRGMRHRSAQRFSFDHPSTTVVVVSEDGPVTVFRGGEPLGLDVPD